TIDGAARHAREHELVERGRDLGALARRRRNTLAHMCSRDLDRIAPRKRRRADEQPVRAAAERIHVAGRRGLALPRDELGREITCRAERVLVGLAALQRDAEVEHLEPVVLVALAAREE